MSEARKGLLLPREGLHADVLGHWIRQSFLNPVVVLPIFLASLLSNKGREFGAQHSRLLTLLKWCVGLGLIRVVNRWLSRRALNNGVVDKYDWTKEIVVVTGGADGIGKRIVQMLATKGVKVAVLDVQPLTYEKPATVTFHTCDITSPASIAATGDAIRSTIGNPTVLINNAGVCKGKSLLESTAGDVDITFKVNSIAHYTLARAFLPYMIAQNHGMVVTVASSAAWATAPRMTEYAASKAAALSFHEGLAAELVSEYNAPRVRTVVVNQGYTRTALFQGFDVKEKQFLAPSLHVDTVAEAIVDQVLSGESGQVILPGAYKLMAAHFRSLPHWLSVPARADLKNLMQNWKGRQVEQAKNE